ncbi:hypothetical protein KO505_14405 [Psychrosphaera sp. F3M07]|uniref:hypothetical protein n=1 Tax=Pseudoalteromonadaceae TaxID=267888 RepID=UPI0006DC8B5E|nr:MULTISPECIES: hypothetical protein [Pseudoalteromonadaceae]KPV99011.1 hypothetical protein AN390_03585 [Pseudoalteromonas sp. P1-11]MBU2919135.1 hypothetical protein [Psychrosphaera sp. F3M07]MDO6637464.1 hypothetical protein [Pseudoalteromonas carrageenovora]MDO6649861.1 hypothetical protein [Pseudoalteromonas carrageenovora]
MKKMLIAISSLANLSTYAATVPSNPESFELVCDKIDVIGSSFDNSRISSSYIKWDKTKKSLSIKSEELNEFHDELNGNHNDIFIRQENMESYPRIYITFKSNPYFEKWKNEYNTRFVTTQIDMSPKSKRALFKLTSFWQTGGVISKVTTKQAWCEIR